MDVKKLVIGLSILALLAGAGLVVQPVQAGLGVALSPQDDGRARAANLPGDLGVGDPLGGQQQDLGAFGQGGPDAAGPAPLAKGAQVFGGNGERRGDRRHEQSCRHHSLSVKSVQRRPNRPH